MKYPVTRAIHALRAANVEFTPRIYTYVEKGGTSASSEALGVDEHEVIKTLIFENENKSPLVVLMHGDKQVSTKQLAREADCKRVSPCVPAVANRHSGYQVGGTSPFGTKKKMPVFMERTILDLERIFINGGSRGFLIEIDPKATTTVLNPTLVSVGI